MENSFFLAKNFLGNLLMPLPMTLLLLLWALLFLLRRKTRWAGFLFVLLATALLFTSSYAPLVSQVTGALEQQYPSYQAGETPADYIAVLGHAQTSSEKLPLTSELSPTAIVRLAEGIRVYRLNPGSRLIFTGYHGTPADPESFAEKMKELALALGVPEGDILSFTGPKDTAEEAQLIAENFADNALILVTTAAHMPRAMGFFKRAGLEPIPAPTHHRSKPVLSKWVFPSARTLVKTQYWLHEQIGLLWAKLMGELEKTQQGE